MKHALLTLCGALLFSSLTLLPAQAETYSGTWTLEPANNGRVQLGLRYQRTTSTGNEEWDESRDVSLSELSGVSNADLNSSGEHKRFSISRDAGTFDADGWFANGRASGSWTFSPSPSFAAQLQRRGVGAPSDKQQFQLAMGDFKLATLDNLLAAGFERPSVDGLVRLAEHGVTDAYIAGLRNVPIRPKTVEELVRMRDHGVTAEYAAKMMAHAPQLDGEDLIRLQDHGVTVDYMNALVHGGYGNVSADEMRRMVDHGVTEHYIAGLRSLGYHPTPEELVRLVDHGVTVDFIERMRSHGYTHLSADDLIRLRDHGF